MLWEHSEDEILLLYEMALVNVIEDQKRDAVSFRVGMHADKKQFQSFLGSVDKTNKGMDPQLVEHIKALESVRGSKKRHKEPTPRPPPPPSRD